MVLGKYFKKGVRTQDEEHMGHVMKETDDMIVVQGNYDWRFDVPKSKIIAVCRNVILGMDYPECADIDQLNVASINGYLPLIYVDLLSESFLEDLIRSTIALFVVIDPIGIVPVFIALTQKMEKIERVSVTKIAIITVAGLLFLFAIAGTHLLTIFGITISSFMVAGGILLFIVAIELLTHGEWRVAGGGTKDESGVVPLAFPLLAGPGAITTVMISYQTAGLLVTAISILIVIGLTYLVLTYVDRIYKVLGRRGSIVVTRVFAVLVAAIAVQFIVDGVRDLFLVQKEDLQPAEPKNEILP